MNYIDIILIVLLVLAMIQGFINGFVREFASLAALILGIWGAIKFSSFTALKLDEFFDMTGPYVGILAFVITFIIIVVIIHFIGVIADKIIELASLGIINKLLGIAFGLVKSVLILSVILTILNSVDARRNFLPRDKINESFLYNPISDIVPSLFPIIGEGGLKEGFDRFKKEPEPVEL